MSNPPRLPDHRSPKRQRLPSVDEEEDDEDYNAASDGEEDDDDGYSDASAGEEEIAREEDEDVEIADDVDGTRMATIGNDVDDAITEAQSRRSVSSSPSSSSSQQCVKLKVSDVLDCPTCCEPLKRPIYQVSLSLFLLSFTILVMSKGHSFISNW